VRELAKWAQEAQDHTNVVDVRHKLMDILFVLNGPSCIQQSAQKAAPGADNRIDDQTLPTVAAIPLMDCSLTPNLPGYVTHIDNHLSALLQSPGVMSDQKTLAIKINQELNAVAGWLEEVQSDALQLVAMSDQQLTQQSALNMRSALSSQATQVLSGGTDPATGNPQIGVQSISLQIQGLAKLNVTTYRNS
jgi:hypothetical protein